MVGKKTFVVLYQRAVKLLEILLSISGYVPKHASVLRTIVMSTALLFCLYIYSFQTTNKPLAVAYFAISEIAYIGFLFLSLSKNGLRKWYIRKWGEEKGFLAFEATIGFLFFNNGTSIGFMSLVMAGDTFSNFPELLIGVIVVSMFTFGFWIKIWAAATTGIDTYYWKDMFLDRKIRDFVVSGPYKYFSNPMYGVGQMQAYAIAISYGSIPGLIVAVLNQFLVFSFFYTVEKSFINRIYINHSTAISLEK